MTGFKPNCDVHRPDLLCPLHVDTRHHPMSQMRKNRAFRDGGTMYQIDL
jgi:hypothetical protein